VFVHGLSDNSRDCWYDKISGSYWPDRILGSTEFADYSIFLGGYTTSKIDSGSYGIRACAKELFNNLYTSVEGRKPVLDHQAVIFICHSLGGVVTRYMLETEFERFRNLRCGLCLIASPSTGSKWADAVAYIAKFLGHEVLQTLQTDSPFLADLDQRFMSLLNEKKIELYGSEACETQGYHRLVGKIVDAESAGRNFGDVTKLAATDHSSCVKPNEDNHPTHRFALTFVKKFESLFTRSLPARRVVDMVCKQLRWDILIVNEDGDAQNHMCFLGITGVAGERYTIPPAKQSAGYVSPPKLLKDRSSPAVELESSDVEPQMFNLKFNQLPNSDSSLDAVYSRLVFNAYSMDSRERKLKTGQSDESDYIQKRITNEQLSRLSIHVQFPERLRIQGSPYLEVRKMDSNIVEADESGRAAKNLDYSPLLRTASLSIPDPTPERAYRVCWRLGPPPGPEPEISEEEQDWHNTVVSKLLMLRKAAEKTNPSPIEETRKQKLLVILADCAGLAQKALPTAIPPSQLEVSLMVVDDSETDRAPILRVAGGSDLSSGYWNLELRIGDGNAGRAVKKRALRIFDADKVDKDPFKHVYKPLPGRLPHRWLMSIPLFSTPHLSLIFGVFNIGTFHISAVRTLRKLETVNHFAAQVQEIIQKGLEVVD